jgi:periplasmic protein TonB
MTTLSFDTQNRIRGGAITLLVEGLIGYGLILGFSVDVPARLDEQLKIFNLAARTPPPPLVKPKPKPTQSKKASGAASPKNIKSKATEIVAPKMPPVIEPPVVAALRPYMGNEASTGATQQRGPGTGAGGFGTGTGSGGEGEGEGGDESGPVWKSGKIKHSDFSAVARDIRVAGTGSVTFEVSVIYVVQPNGRATDCVIAKASGNPAFDQITCRLIEQRMRFRPGLDGMGRPIATRMGEDHFLTVDYEEKTTREYR